MSEPGESDARTLAELRAEIDRIDAAMHGLLVERGTVIDALIRAKGTAGGSAAFRPQREAEMMRRLAARHSGRLPLATAEHVWREIIATFTHMQSAYTVIVEGDSAAMRDLARFTFGFAIAIETQRDAAAVIAAVAAHDNALGLVALPETPAQTPWWRVLGRHGPRIIARLPFLQIAGRPADLPALVIGQGIAEPTPPDLPVVAVLAEGAGVDALAAEGLVAILAEAHTAAGRDALLAVAPQLASRDLESVGCRDLLAVGGFARGVAVGTPPSMLYAAEEGFA